MVRFRTPEGTCLIAAEQVLEVRSAQEVTPFPGRRTDVSGLIERGGHALTVLSSLGTGGNHVLLLTAEGGSFGLLVDEVFGIAKVEDLQIGPAPAGRSRALVEGVVNAKTGIELVISAEELWNQLSADEASAAAAPVRLGDQLPMRVLLVEDNPVVQVMTRRVLDKLGYAIELAGNGKEALELMDRNTYDIVFMDLQMPEMDGIAATKEIVKRWPTGHPPIIAMTGAEADSEREACLAAGMSDYLGKPARQAEWAAMLRKWASARRAGTPSRTRPS